MLGKISAMAIRKFSAEANLDSYQFDNQGEVVRYGHEMKAEML